MKTTNSRFHHLPGKMWSVISHFTSHAAKNFEEERRSSVLAFFLIIGILIILPLTIHLFTLGNVTRAILLLLLGSIWFTSLIALRYFKQATIIFRLNIILLGAYFLFLAHLGGTHGSRILWVFIFPLFAFFLLGKKEGLFWSALQYFLCAIIIIDPASILGTFAYETAIGTRFFLVYGIVILMSYVTEAARHRYQEALERDQRKLQTAHDLLEKRVEERTADLRQANRSLEKENAERKRAEHLVMQEKLFADALINSMPSSFSMFDDQGRMVRWNKRFEELSGYTNEELSKMQLTLLDLMPEADRASVMEAWQKVMRDEKVGFEAGGLRKDGSVISFYYTAARAVVDNQTYVLGSGVDITELKRTEEALKEAYDIISKSPAVAFLWTNAETWPVEFVSVNVETLLGYTAEDFTSGTVSYFEVVHPEDIKRVAEEVLRFSQEEGRKQFSHQPYRIITKDGTIKWVKDSTFIRRDQHGQITAYQGVVEDVTESRTTEEILRESEARFRALVENSPAGIFLIDSNYRFVYANEELCNFLGFRQTEIIGLDFRDVLDDESRQFVEDRYVRRQQGEDIPSRYEVGIVRKDSAKRRLEMVVTAISSPEGSVQTIGQALDITDRKQAEQELALHREHLEELVEERTKELDATQEELIKRERLAVLGQLTATVSHELRNPLGVIRTSAYYLQMKVQAADDKVKKHIRRIEEQVQHCDSIVDDLLEYTRGRHSKMVEGDFNGWITKVLEPFMDAKDVKLVTDLQPALPVVSFDPGKMRRVTVNLVENAIQAVREKQQKLEKIGIPHRPEIRVHTRRKKDGVVLELEDNGVGMDEDTSKRAFEPFFTTKARGTGLGLAVVRKIIEEHRGTVSMESRLENGIKVSIKLPGNCKTE